MEVWPKEKTLSNATLAPSPLQAAAIRAQLARILASPNFTNAHKLSAFLRFVVEETLSGRDKEIKQYTVGVNALGREPTFDPQIDPIVRITAGRLRQALAHFYKTEGVEDSIVITIPKGHYVPFFHNDTINDSSNTTPAAPEQRTTSFQLMVPQGPAIVVLPFDCLLQKQEQLYLADGLAEQLVVTFNRFPEYLMIGPLPRQSGTAVYRDLRAVGQEYGAQFVLSGSLRQQGQRLRLTVKLTDATVGGALWAETFDNDGNLGDLFAFEDMAANRIAAILGDNFGVIPRYLVEKSMAKATEDTVVYDAILRHYHYLAVFSEETHAAAFAALTKAVQIAPDYPLTLALLADMHYLDYHLFGAADDVEEAAERLALRAVTIDPQCQHGHFVLAFTHYHEGQQELFVQKMEQAILINPNNAFLLYSANVYLIMVGEWQLGAACLERAKRLNPHTPGWIFLPAFLVAYLQGDYVEAAENAKRFSLPYVYVGPLIQAVALGQVGRIEEAKTAVSKLLTLHPDFSQRGKELMRRIFFSKKNVDLLVEGLAKVGLQLWSDPDLEDT